MLLKDFSAWGILTTRASAQRESRHRPDRRLKKHVVTIAKVVSELYAGLGINMNPQVSRRVTFALTYLGSKGILDYEALKTLEVE